VVEDPLVGELLALDGARAALGRGDLAGAQAALGRYGERYPRGKLSTEARILRIELLLRQGNREAAHQEASEFLRAHPQSPHAPRLRALLGISTP
jgi:TolA-binding protein